PAMRTVRDSSLSAAMLLATMAAACNTPAHSMDASTPHGDAAGEASVVCTRDRDCGDQELFCARWRCRPGTPGTDARGCIDIGSPCMPEQICDEVGRRCVADAWCLEGRDGCLRPGDCDGDGEPAPECSGHDCDDRD